MGNSYNHFANKEALFTGIVQRLHNEFVGITEPLAQYLLAARFPGDMAALGKAMCEMFARHADYMTLVYVDVAAFGGVHVRPHSELHRHGRALS